MFDFIKRFLGKRLKSNDFIAEDVDEIETDVIKLMNDKELIVDLNVITLVYVLISDFEPEIATFIHALRNAEFTAQEFGIVMLRTGSAFQFLVEHPEITLAKAKEADFSGFSDEIVAELEKKIKKLEDSVESTVHKLRDSLDQLDPEDILSQIKPKRADLSPDELANKLIDEYLKDKKSDKDKNKDKDS